MARSSGKVGIALTRNGKENGQWVYVQPHRLTPGRPFGQDPGSNRIIEGDNLQAMVALLPSFESRVRVIYIDPPYNTGQKDFRYQDDWHDEGPGEWVGADDGRRHSKWLKFMYPRLKLLRRFLTPDGAIFVSIDDRELFRLGPLMDEIFGEQNQIGVLIWHSKRGGGNDQSHVVIEHEYVLCYARQAERCAFRKQETTAPVLDQVDARGPYRRGRELNKWGAGSRREDRPTMWFPVPGPNGVDVWPIRNDGSAGRWRKGKAKMLQLCAAGDVEFVPRGDGTWIAYEKIRTRDRQSVPYRSLLTGVGTYADGTRVLKAIMGGSNFVNPKPVALLQHLIQLAGDSDGLVMDAFAGSGTTAHAVLQANAADGGRRRFLLIESGNGDDRFCTTLTVERVRRLITGEWGCGRMPPLPGGFTFQQVSAEVDAAAGLHLQRQEIIDGIVRTDDLAGMQELPGHRYVFGKARNGRGLALVWDGPATVLTDRHLQAIAAEVRASGCLPPVRIYAPDSVAAPDTEQFEFRRVPAGLLAGHSV